MRPGDKLRTFWQHVAAGLGIDELWTQFRRETRSSMAVYAAETGRDVAAEWSSHKGRMGLIGAVLRAMFARLSPARRILLLIAAVLLVLPHNVYSDAPGLRIEFQGATLSALILFVLLALELADRVGLKRDLEIARDIQRILLPVEAPALAGIGIAFATKAANTVAGDYYDAFLCPAPGGAAGENRLLLLVADVAGKGIPAGMLMASLQAGVHTLAAEALPLADLAARLNRSACERSGNGRHFTTAFLAEIDPATRAMVWVNAGHNPPLLVRAGGAVEQLPAGGIPLGVMASAAYPYGETLLGPGDTLYVYTDGVTEAVNEFGAEYGDARLEQLVRADANAGAKARLERLLQSVDQFAGAAPQSDDITCLVLHVDAGNR